MKPKLQISDFFISNISNPSLSSDLENFINSGEEKFEVVKISLKLFYEI